MVFIIFYEQFLLFEFLYFKNILCLDFLTTYLNLPSSETLPNLSKKFTEVYSHCREPNTIKKYENHFKIWKNWADENQVCSSPAQPHYVAIFLLYLIQVEGSMPKIEGCFYAIKFFHKSVSFADPCESILVKNMFEAAKRIIHHKVTKKKAFKLDSLVKLYDITNKEDLSELRILIICLVGFCGFMRFSEIANLKRSDIIFTETYMKLFIEQSKTDVYREGSWVYIAKSRTSICPVDNLGKYLSLANIKEDSEEFIFRAITKTKTTQKLRKTNKPLSYTRAREIYINVLVKLGLNPTEYGLHSLREAGASAAANNGLPDRLFKRHGRWRSENAKDGYIADDINNLLTVSQNLGF